MSNQLTEAELAALMPSELCAYQTPIPDADRLERRILSRPAKRTAARGRSAAAGDGRRSRRQAGSRSPPVFQTAAGMAASFVAMNEVYGPLFDVTKAEAATPAMAQERAGALKDQFIMDMHTHFLRDDTRIMGFCRNAQSGRQGRLEQGARRSRTDHRGPQVQQLQEGDVSR
jgi:hypothetical protein